MTQSLGTPNFLPVVIQSWPTPTAAPLPGFLLITEVLYDPTGLEPDGEWIEVFNPGSTPVDLSLYKLGDEETSGEMEGMFRFPPGAWLSPGEALVVANKAGIFSQIYGSLPDYELRESDPSIPDMIKYAAWSGGGIELVNSGDEVLLLDLRDQLVDGVSWGGSTTLMDPSVSTVKEVHSIERIPAYRDTDGAGDWIDQGDPSPGEVDLSTPTPTPTLIADLTPTPDGPLTLLISEVLYNPRDVVEPAGEWIEIFNFGSSPVVLDGIKLGDEETPGGGEAMLLFPAGSVIATGGVVVIAYRADIYQTIYGYYPDFEVIDSNPITPQMGRDTLWASGSFNLGNSGDEVLLVSSLEELLDGISWGSSKVFLDPPLGLIPEGYSLERYPPGLDSDQASDWRVQPFPAPGEVDLTPPTPTPYPTATPLPTPVPSLVINEIHADPHAASGDANSDGSVDPQQDEFIEIVNDTGSDVDLAGWTLSDAQGIRHTFPSGSLVLDQCAVVVFGGGAPSGAFGGSLVQISSTGLLGFNNDGDVLALSDPTASIVVSYTYGTEGGDDQSLVRSPDITGGEPLIKHTAAPGSDGKLYSAGVRLDGTFFEGCPVKRKHPALSEHRVFSSLYP